MESIGDRVRRLIGQQGLTQASFADAIGIEATKLSKSLNGLRRFSSLELALIAQQAQVSVDWLLTGQEAGVATAARASAGGSAQTALALSTDYTTLRADLAGLGYRQHWRLPEAVRLEGRWVDQGAQLARTASALLEEARCDVTDDLASAIEEAFGIDVAVQELGPGFDGLAVATSEARLIITGTTAVASRQRFTMAHELGHLLSSDDQRVHKDADIFSEESRHGESEIRANAFASALLMPESVLTGWEINSDTDLATLCSVAIDLKVAPSALAYRLCNLGLIDQSKREELRVVTGKQAAAKAGRSAEFARSAVQSKALRPPGLLLSDALSAYENGDVTLRPYAQLLRVDPQELRRQMAHVGDAED